MSEPDTEQEPSIEEILTSIRQIISDDDDDHEEAAPQEPAEEAIDLTERIVDKPEPQPEPEAEEEIEVEMQDAAEPLPPPARPKPRPAPEPEDDFDNLLTNNAENAAYDAFSALARKTAVEHGGVTLEEIVRTELKPLLKGWLDKNLPHIIERLVQEELERVAKRAMED